jgi:sarcosine oxidase gamma subunit
MLAQGCPWTFTRACSHRAAAPRAWSPKVPVLIHLVDDIPRAGATFDVHVPRSFAAYLWMWLEDAGREYGVQIAPS